jgi:hypothetical protein
MKRLVTLHPVHQDTVLYHVLCYPTASDGGHAEMRSPLQNLAKQSLNYNWVPSWIDRDRIHHHPIASHPTPPKTNFPTKVYNNNIFLLSIFRLSNINSCTARFHHDYKCREAELLKGFMCNLIFHYTKLALGRCCMQVAHTHTHTTLSSHSTIPFLSQTANLALNKLLDIE